MNIQNDAYKKYAKAHAEKSKVFLNALKAFLSGGFICGVGQVIKDLYVRMGLASRDAYLALSITLVFIAVLLTGFGLFPRIAKHTGGGTLVPITGFANSVASAAIDSKSEGWVLGVGSKIFAVAGPVLLYSVLAGSAYGVIYYLSKVIEQLSS